LLDGAANMGDANVLEEAEPVASPAIETARV
jgi:hypothetical protein